MKSQKFINLIHGARKREKRYGVKVFITEYGDTVQLANENFYFKDYDKSKKKTLAAAIEFRDKILTESDAFDSNNITMNNTAVSHRNRASRNTTGVIGVQYKNYNSIHGYIAAWQENKETKTKYFPIKRYPSKKKAFKAAIKCREDMVLLHYRR